MMDGLTFCTTIKILNDCIRNTTAVCNPRQNPKQNSVRKQIREKNFLVRRKNLSWMLSQISSVQSELSHTKWYTYRNNQLDIIGNIRLGVDYHFLHQGEARDVKVVIYD